MNETISQCLHSTLKERFCCRCGIYCEKNMGVYGIKKTFLERQNLNSFQVVDVLRQNQFDLSKNKNYFYISSEILDGFAQIYHICNQIHANYHTKILSLYIFWHSHEHHTRIQQKDILLSVFIALKFQESYMFLRNRKLIKQKLLLPLFQSGQIQEHQLIYYEMERIGKLNFKLKIVSFVDFLEFYVNSGVMFTNQGRKSSDYNKIIHYLDFQTHKYIETGLFFTEPNQQYLALKILYEARKKCGGIDEIWNWHIQYITKTKKGMIDKLIQQKQNLLSLKEINFQSSSCQITTQKNFKDRQKSSTSTRKNRIFEQNLLKNSMVAYQNFPLRF